MVAILSRPQCVNSLAPGDALWCHIAHSTLVQLMALQCHNKDTFSTILASGFPTQRVISTWNFDAHCFNLNKLLKKNQSNWWFVETLFDMTVMGWCWMAPSHYLNQWWHIIRNEVLWHSLGVNFTTKMCKNKANLRYLIAATGLVILLKLDSNRQFSARVTLKFDGWPRKIIGHLFCITSSFVPHLKPLGEFKLELLSGKAQFGSKSGDLSSRVTLKFEGWPWKTIGHLFYVASSFVHHFIAISKFKLKLQSRNAQFGSKSAIYCPLWPWNLTVDLEKQEGTSSMLLQALCIISKPLVNSN